MHSRLLSGLRAQILSEGTPAPLVETDFHFDKPALAVVVCYAFAVEQNLRGASTAHCSRNFGRAVIGIREALAGQLT